MRNKRGQELSIGTLILIILGVVVLALIILGLTTGFDFITKIFEGPGSDLEIVVQGCNIAAQGGLYVDYCRTFREVSVDGEDMFVTCEYDVISGVLTDKLADCTKRGFDKDILSKDYCEGKDADTVVNGKLCVGDSLNVAWTIKPVEGGDDGADASSIA